MSRRPDGFHTLPPLPSLGHEGREVSLPMWHETVHLPLPVVKLNGARASLNRTEAMFSSLGWLSKESSNGGIKNTIFALNLGFMAKSSSQICLTGYFLSVLTAIYGYLTPSN